MINTTQHIGTRAEQFVGAYLQEQGLSFVDRNYRCKYGEIDLIMKDKEYLVFIEVRFRKEVSHGDGAETITQSKKSKLKKSALCYLMNKNLWEKIPCRFDVVSVSQENNINWIKDAFWIEW